MHCVGKLSEWCKRRKVELMVNCVRKQSEWCLGKGRVGMVQCLEKWIEWCTVRVVSVITTPRNYA